MISRSDTPASSHQRGCRDVQGHLPLVPAGSFVDRDLRHAVEHLAEELLDLRVGRERLNGVRRLPLVDPEEVASVLRVQVHPVRDVPGLHGHLLRGAGDAVVDLLDGLGVIPEPSFDGDEHHGCLPSVDRSCLVRPQLRKDLLGCDVQTVLRLGVRLDHRDQVCIGAAGVEPAFALHFLDQGTPPPRCILGRTRWQNVGAPLTVRVYLTGNVAVEDGDTLVSERRFPARQGRLAFAALAWERHRAISTDELADVLWDGEPPSAWGSALRAIISKLRSALGERAGIEQAFGCYQLRLPADAWVDVEACDAAIHEAESALADDGPDRAMGWALVANAIARRPFLAGDDGGWIEHRREHLRQVRVRALEVRGRVSLSRGDHIGTATDAGIILALDPYRES